MKFYLTLGIMLLFLAGCAGPTAYYAGDYGYRYHDHYWYPYTETEPYGQGYGWDSGDDGPRFDGHRDLDAGNFEPHARDSE